MSMQAHGTARKFGDHVDTDVIIPARYLASQDPKELASHCMEDIDAAFVQNHNEGDLMVAGWNFGCGSSREHAPIAIKAAGISCVIAKAFARIFYRNAFDTGVITNVTKHETYQAEPFPPFIKDMIRSGGLMASLREKEGH